MKSVKIYMDVCCLNRPFDDQSQDRVYLEAEAILTILSHCQKGDLQLVASDMIDYELSRLSDSQKLQKVRAMYSIATERLTTTSQDKALAEAFRQTGVKVLDSLHLALCESNRIDALLTTDDRFIRSATKLQIHTKVMNPVSWLMEVTQDGR